MGFAQLTPGQGLISLLLIAASALSDAAPDQAITLQDALTRARLANARLPVEQLKVRGAEARLGQAQGQRGPTVSVEGDLHGGTPQTYESSDAKLQLAVRTPLYSGGGLEAAVKQANAEVAATRAGYQMAVRDVDYAVRVAYGSILHDEATLDFRQRGIARLSAYLQVVESRRAAGQGIGADVLQIRQRLASAKADVQTVTRSLHDERMNLNDLMGRTPDATLTLATLPSPHSAAQGSGAPWLDTPDVLQSRQQVAASEAALDATRAGHKPHVDLEADVGTQPRLGADVAPMNDGTGTGGQVLLTFSLPLWDKGVYTSQLAEANAALDEARKQDAAVQQSTRLGWMQALSDVTDLFEEYKARQDAADIARDAWLQAESLYRGGQSSAMVVLDAYDASTQADQARLDVLFDYRVAEAKLDRWGTP